MAKVEQNNAVGNCLRKNHGDGVPGHRRFGIHCWHCLSRSFPVLVTPEDSIHSCRPVHSGGGFASVCGVSALFCNPDPAATCAPMEWNWSGRTFFLVVTSGNFSPEDH